MPAVILETFMNYIEYQKTIALLLGLAFLPSMHFHDLSGLGYFSRAALQNEYSLLEYGHVGGYAPLREALASYLNGSRGLNCHPDQIIVVSSVRAAVAAVSNVLLARRSIIAVEDPGYSDPRSVLLATGHSLLFVPVDSKGLVVDRFGKRKRCDFGNIFNTNSPLANWSHPCCRAPHRDLKLGTQQLCVDN